MKQILRIRSKLLRIFLKILGLTGLLFIMEACYGAPAYYYMQKDEVPAGIDSLNISKDPSKPEMHSEEDE